MKDIDEYDVAWEQRRRLERSTLRPLGLAVGSAVALGAIRLCFGERPDGGVFWVSFAFAMLFVVGLLIGCVNGIRYHRWRCPRCGRRWGGAGMQTDSICNHCGLHEFEAKEWIRVMRE